MRVELDHGHNIFFPVRMDMLDWESSNQILDSVLLKSSNPKNMGHLVHLPIHLHFHLN